MLFTLEFSKCDEKSIYIYNDPENIKRIALIEEAGRFNDVKDVTAANYSSRTRCPEEGEIIVLENNYGNYALVRIEDVRNKSRFEEETENTVDEITFSYVINPDGGTDFS